MENFKDNNPAEGRGPDEPQDKRLERYASDFELWARECVRISDKTTGREIPFVLNGPQRRVAAILDSQRREGRPMRLILLKARQWGGSTLVQVYMAWMQLVVRRGWNSLTCAHVRDAASGIRGMYSRLLRAYPDEMKDGSPRAWELSPYEKSQTVSYVAARDAQVAIATAVSPNALRGSNFAMAHLSEVAFWGDGDERRAEEIVRTVCGSVALCPDTLVVMESTANGIDNYFHSEWKRAVEGKSDKTPVFVAWHEIDIYRRDVAAGERQGLLDSLDDYECALLDRGIELERVAWYHDKRREYPTHEAMMAEFPTTADEAFRMSGSGCIPTHLIPSHTAAGEEAGDLRRMVIVVAGCEGVRHHHITRVGIGAGTLTAFEDRGVPEGAHRVAAEAAAIAAEHGADVMVVDPCAEGEPSEANRIAMILSRKGVACYCDEFDNDVWRPDTAMMVDMTSIFIEMLRRGEVTECGEVPRGEYLNFSRREPHRYPALTARVVASRIADTPAFDISMLF